MLMPEGSEQEQATESCHASGKLSGIIDNNKLENVISLPWHTMPASEVLSKLKSSDKGLSEEDAYSRLETYGPNEISEFKKISALEILAEQFKNVLMLILFLAAGISFVLGHNIEGFAITIIAFFAITLGFVQEYRAERAIEALREMAAPLASVIRDGFEQEISSRLVVPGDIILVRQGSKIPADARIMESFNLLTEEAALTGESMSSEKLADFTGSEEMPLGDRKNMLYAGTSVSSGRGRAIVVATGMEAEYGKIAGMIQSVEESRTPLQENMDRTGRILVRAALAIVFLIASLGVMRGQPVIEMFIFAIALAVAVVPEALPAVVTISLAIGAQRMTKRHALIRRLPAVETLGCTSVICSDKTGTLTRDEMTVRKIFCGGGFFEVSGEGYGPRGDFLQNGEHLYPPDFLVELLRAAALCSDASIYQEGFGQIWKSRGDTTEAAMITAAAKADLEKADLDSKYPRIDEIPFSSETKRMLTLHRLPQGNMVFCKGAPEIILGVCSSFLGPDGKHELGIDRKEEILDAAKSMAKDALRVLAVAEKREDTLVYPGKDMTFLGLIGMMDPPRSETTDSIETCREAGIKTVMITGDHPLTAEAIAREIRLINSGSDKKAIVTGIELDSMNDEQLEKEAENICVYARVSPAHKLRIVSALQKKGHVVAMTGDGVNDAPALKKADIGIAMGITGTDVTKEASDMTLTDDNFASIVAAVRVGRGIFGNIKKYLMYLLSSNIGEIGLMACASLAGAPLPLSAVQILYVNLATDGLPALALALDPEENDIMKRKPRDPSSGIFTRPVVILMLVGGLWSTIVNFGLFIWAIQSGRSKEEAMTMTFVSLVLIQFFKAYNFRSDRESVLKTPFANKWLNYAIAWELAMLCMVIYIPFFRKLFGVFCLNMNDWIIIITLAFSVSPVLELFKWLERKGYLGEID